MEFRLIPFGDSTQNLELCMQYKIIGLPRKSTINENDLLYFVVKKDGKWHVCGRSKFEKETEYNPFENPGRYYTYSVKDIEACEPFEINTILREQLGAYWGLVFQSPKMVTNKELQLYIEKHFKQIEKSKLMQLLK